MNTWSKKTIVGAVAMALAIPTISFAASTEPTTEESSVQNQLQELQDKRYELLEDFKNGDLTADELLEKFRDMRPEHGPHRHSANLDEETRTKLEEIKQKVEDGELTVEEAKTQMEEIGITPPPFHEELTEEQKQQLEEIRSQVEAGELTKEEARQQLTELGINFKGPHHHHRHHFEAPTETGEQSDIETDL
ncbi:hypothetical protein LCM20_15190 [Halobacillus litoralis]|uniref:hypothetical protein n=1 Tax=Halobacillus litoralis TaxID=45668 RepID=UPI001CD441DC|nr:hypothetical protein [Halobacillus litoralis]MCA0971949.1 hypothetical protein [Halobacillus litoralis]